MSSRYFGFSVFAVALVVLCFAASPVQAMDWEDAEIPEKPFLNDVKCLLLSPYYMTKNTVTGWWGFQKEVATFYDPTAQLADGRKPSTAEKIGYGVFVMPLAAVGGVPLALEEGAITPFFGHTIDLFTSPFGKPLRFHRLDGSGFDNPTG